MGDLIFFVKTVLITFIILTIMQIKVGERTLEQKALVFGHSSTYARPIQEVAQGGVIFIRQIWRKVSGSLNTKFMQKFDSDQAPGKRALGIQIERSKRFLADQARRTQKEVNTQAERAARNLSDYMDKSINPGESSTDK